MFNQDQNSIGVHFYNRIRLRDRRTDENSMPKNARFKHHYEITETNPLHRAIMTFKDLEIIMMLLDGGTNIYLTNDNGQKPLETAIKCRNQQAVMLLINEGAIIGEDLNSLVIMAIETKMEEIAKALIDKSLENNSLVDLKISLHSAMYHGYPELMEYIKPHCKFLEPSDQYIPRELVVGFVPSYKMCVELLLKWNFTVHPDSNQDEEFVYKAVENGYLQIVLELLELGININIVNPDTELSLLKVACYHRYHEIIEKLLQYNAHFHIAFPAEVKANQFSILNYGIPPKKVYPSLYFYPSNVRNKTCLEIAISNCDPVTVKLLLKYHAEIIDSSTLLDLTISAVELNCKDIIHIFMECGVKITDVNAIGKCVLDYCVGNYAGDSKYEITKWFLDRGADIHLQTPNNKLVFRAVIYKHHRIARLFLDYHVNIQYTAANGDTLLHRALEKEFDLEFIQQLLNLHAPVNVKNGSGLTPLHVACRSTSDTAADKIKLLLQYNANIEATAVRGWTPFFEACQVANYHSIKILLDNNVDFNRTDMSARTPLYIAAKRRRCHEFEAIKLLIQYTSDLDCVDEFGRSIIHQLVMNRNKELIELFFHTSINFSSVDNAGNTPLHIAIARKDVNMTKYLIERGADINILSRKSYVLPESLSLKEHKEIVVILKRQIVRLKTAGFKIHKKNHILYGNYNYRCNSYLDISESDCEKEIRKMKLDKIGIMNMTVYDLLKGGIHYLGRFIKNQNIQQILDSRVYDEKYPLYMDMIRCRIREANLRYERVNIAKKHFSSKIYEKLSDDCVDAVIDYLNLKDLNVLIEAFTKSKKKRCISIFANKLN